MKVNTIGGGPGGLYASLLLKDRHPDWDITVYEQNPVGVTYGWGIVFPSRTLSNLEEADEPSHQAITETFERWDPFDIEYKGETFRCAGNTFSSMMRTDLLAVLQERCEEVGVDLQYETEITDPAAAAAEADLCIVADGINSRTRRAFVDQFGTQITEGTARFSWFGTDADFEALTHIFVENEDGIWCAHTYPGPTSTFIIDCDEETWERSGIAEMNEDEYLPYLEDTLSEYLDGNPILSQQDQWRQFRTITNENWYHDNMVLVGDAAHTAHYSIGSGTTLAMEDSIGLMESFEEHDEIEAAFSSYEASRKPFVETLLSAAERSRIHFEEIERYYDLPSRQFALHHLTRSGRLTYGSLQRRDPSFISAFDDWFAEQTPGEATTRPPGFQPVQIAETIISNRFVRVLEPTISSTDGKPSQAQLAAFTASAAESPGLLLTEPLAIGPEARPTIGSPGLYSAEHTDAWNDAIQSLHEHVTAGAHLVHAGSKGALNPQVFGQGRPGEYELTWARRPSEEYPDRPESFHPDNLTESDLTEVLGKYVCAARRAVEAGFGYIQLHSGSDTLLGQLLTVSDSTLEQRLQFPQRVVSEVSDALPSGVPLGVTLPVSDNNYEEALSLDEALVVASELSNAGCEVVSPVETVISERGITQKGPSDFSDDIRNNTGIKTLSAVPTASIDKVNTLIATGRADLCVFTRSPPVDE